MSDTDNQRGTTLGRNTTKRRSILKAMGITSVVGLSGCASGGNGGGNGGDNTPTGGTKGSTGDGEWPNLKGEKLVFLSGEANQAIKKFYNAVNKDFQEATGATVEMNYGGGSEVDRTLIQMLQAGDPPEIFTTGPDYLYELAMQDQVEPITGVFEDWVAEWGEPDQPNHHVNWRDEEWMIPWDVHATLFHYREDVWGVGPNTSGSHPNKWDEFLEGARNAHDSEGLNGCFVGAGVSWCPQAILYQLGYSNSARIGDWNDGDPQIVIDDHRSEWIETLEFVKELHQFSTTASDAECAQYGNAYIGEVASATQYSGGRPKTSAVNEGVPWAGDAKLMPGVHNGTKAVQGKPEGLVTFKEANTKAAKAYMRFLGTSDDAERYLKLLYKTAFGHVLPAFPKISEGPWQEIAKEVSGPNKWREEDLDALREVKEEREWMNTSNQDSLRQYHGPVWNSYGLAEAQHNILVNDADPANEIDTAIEKMDGALKDAKENAE